MNDVKKWFLIDRSWNEETTIEAEVILRDGMYIFLDADGNLMMAYPISPDVFLLSEEMYIDMYGEDEENEDVG